MNISQGLDKFLNEALLKNKRERILGFLNNPKNHKKFSSSLDHDFLGYLDNSKFVSKLSESEMEQEGDLYCSNNVTNNSRGTMLNLYGIAPWEGGWLLINKEGTMGIYRPEGKIDDEKFIKL